MEFLVVNEMVDYIGVTLDLIGFFLILGIGFYAVRLVGSFKRGSLERGWRYITIAALFLVIAQISYLFMAVVPEYSTLAINAGIVFDILGSLFLLIGLRAHFNVWHVNETTETSSATHNV